MTILNKHVNKHLNKSGKKHSTLVLIVLLLNLCLSGANPAENTASIKVGDFIKTILLTGSLQARSAERFIVPMTSTWRIQIKWMVKEGDSVKPGDPVVRFDTANLASESKNIEMNLRDKEESKLQKINDHNFQKFEAEVNLKQAEINYKKSQIDASIPKGLENNFDYDNKQLALKRSKQALDDAQLGKNVKLELLSSEIKKIDIEIAEERAKLEKNRAQLQCLTLIAKTAGTVVYGTNNWEDRKIAVEDTVFASMTVATIPDNSSLEVEAWMNENAVQQIRAGQKVNVRLDAFPERRFTGVVIDVLNNAEAHKQWGRAHYFSVIIKLNALDLAIMKPGMSVQCLVEVTRIKDVLLVPLQSVHYNGTVFSLFPKGKKSVAITPIGFNEFYLALNQKEAGQKGITPESRLLEPNVSGSETLQKEQHREKK